MTTISYYKKKRKTSKIKNRREKKKKKDCKKCFKWADEKELLTTLVMVNAFGIIILLMIMYIYKRILVTITLSIPQGWNIGISGRG